MEELELRDYLRVLRKRRWWVVLALIACLGGAAAFTALAVPSYRGEAKLFVGMRQVTIGELDRGTDIMRLSQDLLESYAEVLRTRPVAEQAVESEGLALSPSRLVDDLRAEPIRETQLIRVSFDHADPVTAQRVVNAMNSAFASEIERMETPRTPEGQPAVRVEIVESALRPESPVSPQPARNMALAGVLGLMLGVGLAFVREYLDTTIKDREDLERSAGTAVLATVPKMKVERGEEVHVEKDPQGRGSEAFRQLRTAVQFLGVDRPMQTILITSAFAREGKTTTATNLAAVFAQAGLRTVLVESDLRRPTIHKIFGEEGDRGLTTALIGRTPLESAIFPASGIRNLFYMPAGAIPPNPVELLASERMGEILRTLRSRYDIVVLDTPPTLPVADASAVAPRADGVLLVAWAGRTNRERLQDATEQLGKLGGRVLGAVLNYTAPGAGGSYEYYYYGYRTPEQSFESHSSSTEVHPPSRT